MVLSLLCYLSICQICQNRLFWLTYWMWPHLPQIPVLVSTEWSICHFELHSQQQHPTQLKSTFPEMLCLRHSGFPGWLNIKNPPALWAPEVPAGWASLQPTLACCLRLKALPRSEYLLHTFPHFWSYIWKPKFSNRIWVVHLHVKMSPKDFINWHVIISSDRENNTKKLNPKFLDSSFVKSENPIFLKFQFLFYLLSK